MNNPSSTLSAWPSPQQPRPAILIVEDQIIIATAMRDSLVELGADVVGPCLTLRSALDAAASAKIDAAVLDVWLSGELSYPVADLLVERRIPFLFTSGVDLDREPPQFHRFPRLLKPFSDQELHSALSGLLNPPRTVPPIAPFAA
ncbi:response regulator receiver protein [Rhizorhabdus wittichii RW1]|uniref:Response regulator receiver protein n=2 Tax=Rhizorhabdus wittichii TaxID=160791 RepID=A0A9J9H7M6_RHIWR|nr:response regulator [Rhizorhabdus wittichii]ABQ66446.1 response regulator receiver protein [Rhizorhabdus wittichii RW1]QTH22363.1 response regulator [Rhizorhabdus wittichii]